MLSIEGNIVNIDKTLRGRIEIGDDGLISSIGKETGKADVVLKDELIFPGFIDLHVHARECAGHWQDYKEDFTTAGQAAINGGVAAFADMPNNPVPPIDEKSYAEKMKLAKKSAVDVLLYAGIGPKTRPFSVSFRASGISSGLSRAEESLNLNNLSNLRDPSARPDKSGLGRDDAFAVPYKVYMGKSVGDLFFNSFDDLESVMQKYRGQNISFHCEDPEILKKHEQEPSHELKRPAEAEISAIDFALKLIEKYQLLGKICHLSTAAGLEKIKQAKKRGIRVTAEVAPHHLYFDQTMITDENRKMLQINPPITQSRENRLALISALKKGDIDYLATDHAPHTISEKEKGASGMPHLDTYGPFAAWLMAEHQFNAGHVARVCCYNPGQFVNEFLNNRYGQIAEGFVGSLAVMDMNRPIKIEKSMLKTKCKWSPFEGVEFPGRVAMTLVKGKVYKN